MADRKRLERIELLTGTGSVFEGPEEISAVRYRVEVLQEKIESQTFGGTSTFDGLKQIHGTVDPVGASIFDLFGKTLTLVFEDGRKMDFFVTNTSAGSIANASGIY